MEKIIYFDFAAIVIYFIIIAAFSVRGMWNNKYNRTFLYVLVVMFISTICDAASIYFDNARTDLTALHYTVHTLYLTLHMLTAPFYVTFLIAQTDTWHKMSKYLSFKITFVLPMLFGIILMFQNLVTGNVFYINSDGEYFRGSLFFLLYLIGLFYMIFGFIYVVYYRELLEHSRFISFVLVFPTLFLAMGIQMLIPVLVIEMFVFSCGMLYIFMLVQRPEERIDTITGAENINALSIDITRASKAEKPLDILIVNIINYELIIKMLGYDGYNRLLCNIMRFLRQLFKNNHIMPYTYHIGNGTFIITIESKERKNTEDITNHINDYLKTAVKVLNYDVNLAAGVCVVHFPEEISELDSLIKLAQDINMDKYTGKVLYANELYQKGHFDVMVHIDKIIHNALEKHNFNVYYQPIYSVKEKRFISAEALIRLNDEKYGFVPPDLFIPEAEKNGTIHAIGEFVLEQVCEFISSKEFKELKIDYIEVNLSVCQCLKESLYDDVIRIMDKYNVKPNQLNLEITETATSYSQTSMTKNIDKLVNSGITFSLDDYGTGYSNMDRVVTLPLRIIKLDKSFTTAERNDKLEIVLENTIKMIKDLNLEIVVEGIETKEMCDKFTKLGCEYIQGYYYSKPIPRDEFVEFIKTNNCKTV